MKTSKRLTRQCGVTIPKDLRLHLGWQAGMSLDLETTKDGALLIRPHNDACRFCGTIGTDIRRYKDVCLCPNCAALMKEAL